MLTKCANVFETELETLIGGMTKMIEPMVIVVLGSIVSVILVGRLFTDVYVSRRGLNLGIIFFSSSKEFFFR